ncbi:tail tape measure protein [Stakelama tenebrarum]|uniref:Tail tape measure protein n=1 Tax=Stakelama tenebrarum TaxID=2711215 RepID=A0A6G6Y9F0_9SPHN|nr:tail tape measure protein [Sphingosinithalassobacter tenebrarum]QIG81564.1 tail tape measure protein [Sphingosinithalassobacter tenebrarum]
MDEEIERLIVSVRADTQGFARDVADMRGTLDGTLVNGVERAGRIIENSLLRAIRTGKLEFADLGSLALSVLDDIAGKALDLGLEVLTGGSGGGLGGGLLSLIGLPGRATGGPVSPGRPYVVGERGPELFVPTSAGAVAVPAAAGSRDVRVAITINAAPDAAPRALQQSSRQVARAVKAALAQVG